MTNKIILYHAGWCGPCKNYTREGGDWDKIKDNINQMKSQGQDIDFEEYQLEENGELFEEANIKSFPTLKISRNGKVSDFKEDRTDVDGIISNVMGQAGGGLEESEEKDYEALYKKYKSKYLQLKKELGL